MSGKRMCVLVGGGGGVPYVKRLIRVCVREREPKL